MKVGTDGVLLGAYVDCDDAEKILDIGTGTGLIAIMLAQKSLAQIDAIDIQKDSVILAKENIENCPWNSRIYVYDVGLQEFKPNYKYDLIVSNPPYYTTDIIAPESNRAISRHNLSLNIKDLAEHSCRLLSNKGKLYVIYPTKQAYEFESIALQLGLHKNTDLLIRPNILKNEIVRVISEYSFFKTNYKSKIIHIEKDKRQDYTNEFREITKEYYLNF